MGWFRPRRQQGDTFLQHVSWSEISAAVLVMALLAGCSSSSNPCPVPTSEGRRSSQASPPKMHVHANGLQLSVGESCQVRTTPAGFVIEPPNKDDHRYPFKVAVQMLETPPEATGHRVRYLGSGRILWYSATSREAGMGDPEWEIIAFEHVDNYWIRYWENKQDEWQPDELWEIARGLSYVR